MERFDVRAATSRPTKRWVFNLDRRTSQLERHTFVSKRKRSTAGAAQCQAVMLLRCAALPETLPPKTRARTKEPTGI